MLQEITLFGVVDKVNNSIFLLQKFEPADGYFVCFSGGKDSVVVLDLVKRAGVKYQAFYNYMTIEPPELLKFIIEDYPEVEFLYPEKTMYDLIIYNHIPPMRTARYCCRALKVNSGQDKIKVTGIRRQESRYRADRQEVENGGKLINPIVSWSNEEIWEYIRKYNVKYCKLYDSGRDRIGCIFCPNSNKKQMEDDIKNYPDFVNYYIAALDKVLDIQRRKGKISKYKSGSEWFYNWALQNRSCKACKSGAEIDLF